MAGDDKRKTIPVPATRKKDDDKPTQSEAVEKAPVTVDDVLLEKNIGEVVIGGKKVVIESLKLRQVLELSKLLSNEFKVIMDALKKVTIAAKGKPTNAMVATAIIDVIEVETALKLIGLILNKDVEFAENLSINETIDVVIAFVDAQEVKDLLLKTGRLKTMIVEMKAVL